ncbi:iron-containing alcohol dehydrogenase [Williamwhitmania taraxaci]|uniref:NADP-dependent alcohol dehydrogenase n=1 Tax=Williamwhitmania taraxaci TaxID=1640674 RepID=A0A1G6QDB6_9BACT|nr:iron-containing alcohol dehydrogenase [Williamwhitmania taraxaci]SDC90480.1 NADP-dependent alcohol dehydrogenase [Williamwhitmania taraxaci]
MNNFEFFNPVKVIFGKDQLGKLSAQIPANKRVLMIYGGGSILKNGVHAAIINSLKDYTVLEFNGIEPNPKFETAMKVVEMIKAKKIDFLLAVGGGSVIDATKFIAAAAMYSDGDPWDILAKRKRVKAALPFGAVLTLPATGSEMNNGAVITREATHEKLSFMSPLTFPLFSFLLPDAAATLPQRQVANGVVDAFMHVMEQYMTFPANAPLQDRFAESILQTLVEEGPKAYANPANYEAMSNLMWSATMALNGLIGCGVPQDWAVHMIGHELTAQFGIDHARTLAIIAPSHYAYNLESKKEKLAQFGQRVWGITEGTLEEKATAAIKQTVEFFHSLDVDTKLSDYTDAYKGTAQKISTRFTERGWAGLGEHQSLTPSDVEKIVEMSY